MNLQDYMNRSVLVLPETLPAEMAARAMLEKNVGSVLISDRVGHIVGIVTDRDLGTEVLGLGICPDSPLYNVMSKEVISISPEDSLEDAIDLMVANGIRRVPIIDRTSTGHERCTGIVTMDDLLADKVLDKTTCAEIVQAQLRTAKVPRESRRRQAKQARHEQQMHRFFNRLITAMHLGDEKGEQIAWHLLQRLLQRVPPVEASHFLAQLPLLVRNELEGILEGPDRNVTVDALLLDLQTDFAMSPEEAKVALAEFWLGLEEIVDPGALNHLLNCLPQSFEAAFIPQPSIEFVNRVS